MPAPYNVKENKGLKESSIQTPIELCKFIHDIIPSSLHKCVLDVGCNAGNLSRFFEGKVIGIDSDKEQKCKFMQNGLSNEKIFYGEDFLNIDSEFIRKEKIYPDIIISNPPFNNRSKGQGRKLLPEVFLHHMFYLWGINTPIVIFAPMGFRLNQRIKSKRWRKLRNSGAEITSIISLPLDIFESVEFHSEILMFNVYGVKPHYFIGKEYVE